MQIIIVIQNCCSFDSEIIFDVTFVSNASCHLIIEHQIHSDLFLHLLLTENNFIAERDISAEDDEEVLLLDSLCFVVLHFHNSDITEDVEIKLLKQV